MARGSREADTRPLVSASYRQIVIGHLPRCSAGVHESEDRRGGLAANTVRNHHSVLRRALGQAERWGLAHRNVARLVSPPRVLQDEVKPFTSDEARQFFARG